MLGKYRVNLTRAITPGRIGIDQQHPYREIAVKKLIACISLALICGCDAVDSGSTNNKKPVTEREMRNAEVADVMRESIKQNYAREAKYSR